MKELSNKSLDVIFKHLEDGYHRLRQKHLNTIGWKERQSIHEDMMRTLSVMSKINEIKANRLMERLLKKQLKPITLFR